jgi:4-amino-4-deoxy-L-arabinose transferase-like glycosyltransferase
LVGRASDEAYYVNQGYTIDKLFAAKNFTSSYWYTAPDPPIVSKYIYGIGAQFDFMATKGNTNVFHFNFPLTRAISLLFAELSVLLVIFIGWRYFSFLTGSIAGITLATLPYFLGLAQLVSMESLLLFFFTAAVFSYLYYFEKPTYKKLLLSGIVTGICFFLKYTNIMLIPLFCCLYFVFVSFKFQKGIIITFLKRLLLLCSTAVITCIIIWPEAFLHLPFIFNFEKDLRFTIFSAPPELFFGTFKKNPFEYYLVYFFITTPIIYLFLFFVGVKKVLKKKNPLFTALVIWFLLPFAQSFYPFRQQGIRYIIQIYGPFSLLVAIGFGYMVKNFTKKITTQLFLFMPILFINLSLLFRIGPYYLDYFNLFIGGTKHVYEKHLFFQGWWGNGQKEAALYIEKHAKKDATVGLVLNPTNTWKFSDNIAYSTYDHTKTYDYVVVNHYAVVRNFFDTKPLQKRYKLVFSSLADGARLVDVYQKK